MRKGGLEPPRIAPLPPQGSAYTSSATFALGNRKQEISKKSRFPSRDFCCRMLPRLCMKYVFIVLIQLYRLCISPFVGSCCRFAPSCSAYAEEAFRTYGVVKGLGLTCRRLVKCGPWHPGGYDPVIAEESLNSYPDESS
jgi:uncharacterized protein